MNEISFSANARPFIGDKLEIKNLKSILEHCKNNIKESEGKGQSGSIFPYVSNILLSTSAQKQSDGVIFIDIDNCKDFSNIIFDKFDSIASLMPNLIAVNFSKSKNIHAFIQDNKVKENPSLYKERASLWLAYFAECIKRVCNIDLRTVEKALDTHNCNITQRFYLNYSDYKWNNYVNAVNLDNKTISKLKSEYYILFRREVAHSTILSTPLKRIDNQSNTDKPKVIKVNSDFYILGRNGYAARSVIASAAYFHFKMNFNKTEEYISNNFQYTKEWQAQLASMVHNNTISSLYSKDVEDYLFQSSNGEILLEEGTYISDVFDIDNVDSKYIYIQSGTNTGKTEYVKKYLNSHDNTAIIQMTKALRDGKKKGVENSTYSNWEKIVDPSKVHTTLDGFVYNSNNINIEDYVIFVDETHLLQDYINVRYEVIKNLLTLLDRAKKLVFLSATPKRDIDLFPFKLFKFAKKQPQEVYINRMPLRYETKTGSKENAKYTHIIDFVNERVKEGRKVIIYSDRNQECYKKYGLANQTNVTYFNSLNIKDPNEISILEYNRLDNPITLATRYLGVGVEIKNEEEVDIVFCLDEMFTSDFIIQCIGRPRDAKRINVFCFYTNNNLKQRALSDEEMGYIEECFKKLNIMSEDGMMCLNLIAAKGINLYDDEFYAIENPEKIKALKIGNILDRYNNMNADSLEVLTLLPYKKVEIVNNDPVTINNKGKICIKRKESELEQYLLSLDKEQLTNLFLKTYEEIFEMVPYNDKTNARKFLKKCKLVNYYGMSFDKAVEYFGSMEKAAQVFNYLFEYINVKAGRFIMDSIEGLEDKEKDLKKHMMTVELTFDEDWLKEQVDKAAGKPQLLDFIGEDLFGEIVGIDEPVKNPQQIVKGDNFKKVNNTLKGKASSQWFKIKHIETGKEEEFESVSECQEFLGIGKTAMTRFMKGQSKLNKMWKIIKNK